MITDHDRNEAESYVRMASDTQALNLELELQRMELKQRTFLDRREAASIIWGLLNGYNHVRPAAVEWLRQNAEEL